MEYRRCWVTHGSEGQNKDARFSGEGAEGTH